MGGSSTKLPYVARPDGYDASKEILDDPFYGPHYQFFAARKDNVQVDPSTPARVMGKVYACPEGYSQIARVSVLLDQRRQMNGDHCLRLLSHESNIAKGVHTAIWEFPSYTLDAEVKARAAEAGRLSFVALTQYFNDPEVWAFIKFLVVADIEFCRKLSRYHGDIQPRLVMLSKDGKLFLNDILSFTPQNEDGYMRMLHDPAYMAALSPEAAAELNAKVLQPTFDANKNDVFGIAVTVLACCSEPALVRGGVNSFYRRSAGRIELNREALETALAFMLDRQHRSPVLVNALRSMLAENPADRPSLYQILEFMRIASA